MILLYQNNLKMKSKAKQYFFIFLIFLNIGGYDALVVTIKSIHHYFLMNF